MLGMQVVQTPSPWAIVASRWTWLPRTRLIASVSASHSCGNSWATWATGQCCWHSCSPTGLSRTVAAYPSAVNTWARISAEPSSGCSARIPSNLSRMNATRRVANSRTASSPPVSARNRSAWAARSSYCWSKPSRPDSVSANDLGRPAAAAGGLAARLAGLDRALLEQLVEVAAYGGRGQVEPLGEGRGGRGSVDEDRPGDALARRLVVPVHGLLSSNSTTPVCRYCFDCFKEGDPYLPRVPQAEGVSRATPARSLH